MRLQLDRQYTFVALCIAAVWGYYTYSFFNYFVDDAYISLTYARNFLAGEGLTWSGERVEGYTNFLFIMLCSALSFLTGIALPLCTRLINGFAFLGILYLVWDYASLLTRNQPEAKTIRLLALLAVGFSLPLAAFVFAGLESVSFTFLCVVPLYFLLSYSYSRVLTYKRALTIGFMLSLATLTRPEGIIIAALTGVSLLILGLRPLLDFKRILCVALPYLIVVGCYVAWKYLYFGDIFPNTYYVKATQIPSALRDATSIYYLTQYFLRLPLYTIYGLGFLIYFGFTHTLHKRHLVITIWMVCYFIYAFFVGVDYMAYFRFILPIIVLEVFLILEVLYTLLVTKSKKVAGEFFWLFAVCAVLQCLQMLPFNQDTSVLNAKARQPIFEQYLPRGATIALNAAGYLPFALPQYRYIDMLGLNDKHIAKTAGTYDPRARNMVGHQKADADYVLSKKPEVIILSSSSQDIRHASDFQLIDNKQFYSDYLRLEYQVVPEKHYKESLENRNLNSDGTVTLAFYVHKDAVHYFPEYKTTPVNPDLFSGQK